MKVFLLLLLATATFAIPRDSKHSHRFRRRAAGSWASNLYTCPTSVVQIADSDGNGKIPLGKPTNVKLVSDKYTFIDSDSGDQLVAYSSTDGAALKGEMAALDMCKVRPKEMCKHARGTNFCTVIGKGYCCLKQTSGDCKAMGVGRKYMPQLKDGVNPNLLASYEKLVKWLGTNKVTTKFEESDCEISKLSPSQDEIFWEKTAGKVCFGFDPVAKKNIMRTDNKPSGVPETLPLVDKDCVIIDGHHRWSQAALCDFVKDCPATLPKDKKIKVIKATVAAVDVLKVFIDFAKHAKTGWPSKSKDDQQNKKTLPLDDAEFFFQSTGPEAFMEVDAKFGRAAHRTVEAATAAFVADRKAELDAMDMELKGGDEALAELFLHFHAPRLWN